MTKKETPPNDEAASNNVQAESKASDLNNSSAAAQRGRVVDMLRTGAKSTLQFRRDGDILAPAARILELRKRGFEIMTQWIMQATDCGKLHRVALYVLIRESGGQL